MGNLFSADIFYNDDPNVTPNWQKLGALAVEMEAAGLYMNAARAGKKALAICCFYCNCCDEVKGVIVSFFTIFILKIKSSYLDTDIGIAC